MLEIKPSKANRVDLGNQITRQAKKRNRPDRPTYHLLARERPTDATAYEREEVTTGRRAARRGTWLAGDEEEWEAMESKPAARMGWEVEEGWMPSDPLYIGSHGCLGFIRGLSIVGRAAEMVVMSRPFDPDRAVAGGAPCIHVS